MSSENIARRLTVVMGVTGCGKSTVGTALADRLGKPFLDADDFHPAANIEKMSRGIALDDEDRWPWLDNIGRALGEQAGMVVVACSALRRAYRERLIAAAGEPILFVFLNGPYELIAARLATRAGHYMPAGLLDSQFATLEIPADDETALAIDISPSVSDVVDNIHAGLTGSAGQSRAAPSMTEACDIGVVGLGVMGRNLALNMADKGFSIGVYDTWTTAGATFAAGLSDAEARCITSAHTPAELVTRLAQPRTILVMVKAGDPVDDVIESLVPHLAPRDTLIDGGNSHYHDTIRRETALRAQGFHFIGLGISGGEEGARHGPSMMAGGAENAYANSRAILEAISAKFNGEPCCALVGGDGAGHFVKMVHNGIEYGIMQVIAEVYVILRDLCVMNHADMAAVFDAWNATKLPSYLVEITAQILAKKDDLSDTPLVEMILDKAGQKGTGRWSSEAALEFGVPTPSITEAVFARALASMKDQRITAAAVIEGPQPVHDAWADSDPVDCLGQALLGAVVAIYAQGFALIEAAGQERAWPMDLATVATIWREGCVIRAALLDDMARAYRSKSRPENLLADPGFAQLLADNQAGWRRAVAAAALNGIPAPGLSSALAYFDGYRSARSSANMIQAQRDFFGAHTYERTDRPGFFHTQW